MRRLIGIAVLAAGAATVVGALRARRQSVASSGNGHTADEARIELLRERIAAARRRMREEFDSVRGNE